MADTIIFPAENIETHDEKSLSPYGQRIAQGLKHKNRTQAWLAHELGISKQALYYLMRLATKCKFSSEIAHLLGLHPLYLKSGKGRMHVDALSANGFQQIPLLQLNEVAVRNELAATAGRVMLAIDATQSAACFAVKLSNTSMEPLFQSGSILIFDGKEPAQSGDHVIVTLGNQETLVRQYFVEGNDWYFKANNPMYRFVKTTPKEAIIQGVLIESRHTF